MSPAGLAGLPVLVVDDNATNRRILEKLLLRWGMRPTAVASAAEALEVVARGQRFRLILTDGQLPEADGFALAARLRQNPNLDETAIILMSSACQRGDAARCGEAGIQAYLTKPIHQSELLDVILSVVGLCAEPAAESREASSEPTPPPRDRGRILLAEDNLINQKVALRLLEKRGYVVTVAANGREALEAMERQSFDAVLMDVHMPEMDGLAATAELRVRASAGRKVPIIAMTANAMKGDREMYLAAGMDDYIAKPIRAQELYAMLDRWLAATPAPTEDPACLSTSRAGGTDGSGAAP